MKKQNNTNIEKLNKLIGKNEDVRDEETLKYISFDIKNERYGIEVGEIIKIVQNQDITKIPDLPAFVIGVIQVQNKIIPIVSLSGKFGLGDSPENGSIIIVLIQGQEIGLMIDRIGGIMSILRGNIVDVPKIFISRGINYFAGIGILGDGKVVTFLDTNKILKEDEIRQIENIKQENT